jgi:hypothetical protein
MRRVLDRFVQFVKNMRKILLIWLVIVVFVILGIHLGWDEKVIATIVLIFGFLTHAFSGLMGLISLIPTIGPMIVNVITLPFFLVINGIAYLVTFIALRRGYRKDVVSSRLLTVSLLIGIIIGYILGKVL